MHVALKNKGAFEDYILYCHGDRFSLNWGTATLYIIFSIFLKLLNSAAKKVRRIKRISFLSYNLTFYLISDKRDTSSLILETLSSYVLLFKVFNQKGCSSVSSWFLQHSCTCRNWSAFLEDISSESQLNIFLYQAQRNLY